MIDAMSILTALMIVLLGLSTWTLVTLHTLSKAAAAQVEKDARQDATLEEDRARIISLEKDVRGLELDMAGLDLPPPKKR